MHANWFGGIDCGRSALKLVAFNSANPLEKIQLVLPNALMPMPAISDPSTLAAIALDRIQLGETGYLGGPSAETLGDSGNVPQGMSDAWFSSAEHAAMVGIALNHLTSRDPRCVPGNGSVMFGLPVSATKKDNGLAYKGSISAHLGMISPSVRLGRLEVSSQARGPMFDYMLGDRGEIVHDLSSQTWAVVEIGHYSTDCMVVRKGLYLEREHTSLPGMRLAADYVQQELRRTGADGNYSQVRSVIETGRYMHRQESVDARQIRDAAVIRLARELRVDLAPLLSAHLNTLDGVILAGGGAELLAHHLSDVLPNALVPTQPRFSVARGFAKAAFATSK